MAKKYLLLSIVFFIPVINLLAQDSTYKVIKGIIVDTHLQPVSSVNISISGTGRATFSNEKGEFEIFTKSSDTLLLSSVVYKKLRIPVNTLKPDMNYITMHEQVYELNVVDIKAMRWMDFKYTIMNTKLKPTEEKILVIKGLPYPFVDPVPAKITSSNPVTFLYYYFKKENVRKRKQKRWNKIANNSSIKVE